MEIWWQQTVSKRHFSSCVWPAIIHTSTAESRTPDSRLSNSKGKDMVCGSWESLTARSRERWRKRTSSHEVILWPPGALPGTCGNTFIIITIVHLLKRSLEPGTFQNTVSYQCLWIKILLQLTLPRLGVLVDETKVLVTPKLPLLGFLVVWLCMSTHNSTFSPLPPLHLE